MKINRKFFSRRLKLILVLGCLGGLAVALFGRYVDSISDLPVGPTPLSWTFKASSAGVAATFADGTTGLNKDSGDVHALPELDLTAPVETEFALFALG